MRSIGTMSFAWSALAVLMGFGLTAHAGEITKWDGRTLNVGDPAPPMKVGAWVKGKRIENLATGRITVIDFWGTLCVPCIRLFPELSELARKYQGQVDIIGVGLTRAVDMSPYGDSQEARQKFMRSRGGAMEYNVAFDTQDGYMMKYWMAAAGFSAIPTAFIVDAAGRIAWYGSGQEVGAVLPKVVEGTFDTKAYATRAARKPTDQVILQRKNAAMSRTLAALKAQDYAKVLSEYDSILLQYPESEFPGFAKPFRGPRLIALAHMDEERAYDLVRATPAGYAAYDYARLITQEDGLSRRLYEYAAVTLQTARHRGAEFGLELPPELGRTLAPAERMAMSAALLEYLARAHWKLGNRAAAVETQQQAIDMTGAGARKEALQKTLETYRQDHRENE